MWDCSEPGAILSLLGVGQFIFACAMTLFYPTVQSEWYVYTPTLLNSTLSGRGKEHGLTIKLGIPCLFTSLVVVGFTSVTNKGIQSGAISESSSYNPEALSEAGPWNVIFWFIVFTIHGIVFTATSSPGDFFGLALCTCVGVYCLQVICSPSHEHNGHGPVVSFAANFGFMGYAAALLIAFNLGPPQYPNRYIILFLLGTFDYFLCVGHTWDRAPTMQTIANCRLFYVCCSGLALMAMYGIWHDPLLLAYQ